MADTVPDMAPDMKEVVSGDRSGRDAVNCVFRISNPAQYRPACQLTVPQEGTEPDIPENGTSRQRVGPRPRHRMVRPLVFTNLPNSFVVVAYVGDMRSAACQLSP